MNSRAFACFFSGLSAGIAIALMVAPRSRTEIKEEVQGKLREGKESIEREKDRITAAIDAGKRAYRETA